MILRKFVFHISVVKRDFSLPIGDYFLLSVAVVATVVGLTMTVTMSLTMTIAIVLGLAVVALILADASATVAIVVVGTSTRVGYIGIWNCAAQDRAASLNRFNIAIVVSRRRDHN